MPVELADEDVLEPVLEPLLVLFPLEDAEELDDPDAPHGRTDISR